MIKWFQAFPPEIASFILAMLPVTELRGALPLALTVFELPVWVAYIYTVAGNLVPILAIYLVMPRVMRWAAHQVPVLDQWLKDYHKRLEEKYGENYSRWGAFFLLLFVAIPLPGSGAWTGTVLAIIFNIKQEIAVPYLIAGVCIAGLVVLSATLGIEQLVVNLI